MKCGNQESKAFSEEAGPPELALVGEVVRNYKPLNLGFGPWSIREYICGVQRSLKSIVQRSRDTNPICIHHKWLQFSTVFLQKDEEVKAKHRRVTYDDLYKVLLD